jgi:hypothetical protein
MLILYPQLSLLIKTSFILKPLLNSITIASLGRLKLIHNLLKYHHILLLLLSLAISVLSFIFIPLVFKLESKTRFLKLPYHLHPYPLDFFRYIPHISREDHVTAERHVEAFESFIDQLEIVHEDVTMRLFSKSLLGDVVVWFKGLGFDSIGS